MLVRSLPSATAFAQPGVESVGAGHVMGKLGGRGEGLLAGGVGITPVLVPRRPALDPVLRLQVAAQPRRRGVGRLAVLAVELAPLRDRDSPGARVNVHLPRSQFRFFIPNSIKTILLGK